MKLPPAPRVVITGAGSGLGRALALELARRQARILVADIKLDGANETVELIDRAGGSGEAMRADVSELEDMEALAARAETAWQGVDLLVNNAGVAAAGPVGEMPIGDWRWIMGINLWGVIHGCHAFVPRMKERKRGWIINVASCAGIASLPEMGAYNVTKAGVISLSETLHLELAPFHIAVSALCPTFFKTNLMDNFRAPSERQRRLADTMFERSKVTAAEVARAALRGLERDQVIVIPQRDGAAIWRAKRFVPSLYYSILKRGQRFL